MPYLLKFEAHIYFMMKKRRCTWKEHYGNNLDLCSIYTISTGIKPRKRISNMLARFDQELHTMHSCALLLLIGPHVDVYRKCIHKVLHQ
jgi:hypothetical protein